MSTDPLARLFPFARVFAWGGLDGEKPEPPPAPNAHRNPYPPAPVRPEPPAWFQRWWPVVLSVGGFVTGLVLLVYDVRQGSLTAIPAVVYLTLMGYLPVTVATKWFKNGRS